MGSRLVFIVGIFLGSVLWAQTYNCSLKTSDTKKQTQDMIWQGSLSLTGDLAEKADMKIITANGKAVSFPNLSGPLTQKDIHAEVATRLKPYEGNHIVSLRAEAGKVLVSLGHVDTKNQGNFGPFDALAWASSEAREIGVLSLTKRLELACVKAQK